MSLQLTVALANLNFLQDDSLSLYINSPGQLNAGHIFGNVFTAVSVPKGELGFNTKIQRQFIFLEVEEKTLLNLRSRPCLEKVENVDETLPR